MGFAAERDLDGVGIEAGREFRFEFGKQRLGEVDVMRLSCDFVVEMGVRAQIGAVAGGAALEIDGAHEVALHERLKAVINGG